MMAISMEDRLARIEGQFLGLDAIVKTLVALARHNAEAGAAGSAIFDDGLRTCAAQMLAFRDIGGNALSCQAAHDTIIAYVSSGSSEPPPTSFRVVDGGKG